MEGSSGSGSAGSLSWPSLAPFEVSVYLQNYRESLVARRFQAMPAGGNSRTPYDARRVDNRNSRVRA